MITSVLGEMKEGLLFIVSAPAGTGKTTLVRKLIKEFPSIVASVSYTTRQPRKGEIQGVHYHFVTESQFKEKIAADDFLEYVKLYDTYYGTSKKWVEDQLKKGKHVVLVIDTQGAKKIGEVTETVSIFIRPPSLEVLGDRLMLRQTETQEMIEKRMEWAQKELEAAKRYDYQLVNDDLDTAYQVLRSIFIAESHRVKRS